MRLSSAFLLRPLIIMVLLGQIFTAQADGDHDETKRLLKSGNILSLEVILEKLRPRYPGKILEVELERKSNHIVYEVEIVGDDGIVHELYIDAKSHFQEQAQEKLGITPIYKILESSGPDHAKVFKIGVYLDKELVATGSGTSKQEAQTEAAKKALKNKNWSEK